MQRGTDFELEVKQLLEHELRSGSLGIDACHATVHHHKGYFSRQRTSEIIVDVSIEVRWKDATEPYLLWIWECKNYRHPVPVDDVEEFHAKLQQIGADGTKGTIVTRSKFQRAALEYALANRIGLARFAPESRHLQHVAYCMIKLEPYSSDEIKSALLVGRRAPMGDAFYGVASRGIYVDELSELIKYEVRG